MSPLSLDRRVAGLLATVLALGVAAAPAQLASGADVVAHTHARLA